MPETTDTPVTAAQLTASLAGLIHGPYADDGTADAADLAAEAVRYLNQAAGKGGITDPATIAAETAAGRIADDHRRSPGQLTARIRAAISQAAAGADALTVAIAAVHNLTATLHTAETAEPAELAEAAEAADPQRVPLRAPGQ